ncbi:hypothetical protein H9P43_005418 [Blastocladiella emersonii ATCC 22665]|nr:hypothetical protein H9P43_005418 [Blastocladiella emersonii ATCC 22665]
MKADAKPPADVDRGPAEAPPSEMLPAHRLPLTCSSMVCGEQFDVYSPYRRECPRDLFLYHDPTGRPELKALVCGCGDLRDVVRTLEDYGVKQGTAKLSFVLNDLRPEILARNLLILHTIVDCRAASLPVDWITQLWYSLLLEPGFRDFWDIRMRACLAKDWLNVPNDAPLRVLNEETLRAVRHCWQSWLDADWTPETLFAQREHYYRSHPDPTVQRAASADHAKQFMAAVQSRYRGLIHGTKFAQLACHAERHTVEGVYLLDAQDRRPYDKHGRRAEPESDAALDFEWPEVNPTMLLVRSDGSLYYALRNGNFPFEATSVPLESDLPEKFITDEMYDWTWILQRAMTKASGGGARFTFAAGHALTLMETLAADPAMRFDVIDTSNLMDSTCPLFGILIHGAALLTPIIDKWERSMIFAYSTKLASSASSHQDLIFEATGLDYGAFAAFLGVHLTELPSEEGWATYVRHIAWTNEQLRNPKAKYFSFYKIRTPTIPTALADSPFLRDALTKSPTSAASREPASASPAVVPDAAAADLTLTLRSPLTCGTVVGGEQFDVYTPCRRECPRDLFHFHSSRELPELKAFVCGCGDLRDLIRTLDDFKFTQGTAALSFLLNDERPETVAPNCGLVLVNRIFDYYMIDGTHMVKIKHEEEGLFGVLLLNQLRLIDPHGPGTEETLVIEGSVAFDYSFGRDPVRQHLIPMFADARNQFTAQGRGRISATKYAQALELNTDELNFFTDYLARATISTAAPGVYVKDPRFNARYYEKLAPNLDAAYLLPLHPISGEEKAGPEAIGVLNCMFENITRK